MALTPRGRALRWLTRHRGITEQPPGSNTDLRADGIRHAQNRLGGWLVGLAWCGVWACNAALQGGVKMHSPYRWASVELIEMDARARTNGFLKWVPNHSGEERGKVMRGDLVVWFGRGIHVGMFRQFVHDSTGRVVGVIDDEGNTSSGAMGSQNNGGGSYRRVRPISDVYGFARVNYPNGNALAQALSSLPRPGSRTKTVVGGGTDWEQAGIVTPEQAEPDDY